MNYSDPHLVDRLAGEYVLGTLSRLARRRFERVLARHFEARRHTWRWEAAFGTIAERVPPIEPHRHTWQRIENVIKPTSARRHRFTWSWAFPAAAALTLAVYFGITELREPPSEPGQIAVIDSEQGAPLWLISVDQNSGVLRARALNAGAADVDRAFELWLLAANGAPRSLGLLPANGEERTTTLPAGLSALLSTASGIAVSIEPAGGSPTGLPTGPVVYQEQLVRL